MVDAATAVQDQVLETITTAQDATLKVLKGWTDTLSSAPSLSEVYPVPKMDTFYGFAEKLWATEKDFFVKLLEGRHGSRQEGSGRREEDRRRSSQVTPAPR